MDSNNNISDSKTTNLSEQQVKFIWLAYGEGKSYSEISKLYGINRSEITEWENAIRPNEFSELKQYVSSIRKIYMSKKFTCDFNTFKSWFIEMQNEKKCTYCGITEAEIELLCDKVKKKNTDDKLTTRSRVRKLELDRKHPKSNYDDLTNIVHACYWCNNAKTDTFTHEEFLEVGKVISKIWRKRLSE